MNHDRLTIYVDIETTGTESDRMLDRVIDVIRPPKNYKDPDKIEAYLAEKRDDAWSSTAVQPHAGRIACIGTAIGDTEPEVIADDNEHALLRQWFTFVRASVEDSNKRLPLWCGWNVMFDLRFLWARALINRVDTLNVPLYETSTPWAGGNNVLDLKWRMTGEKSTSKIGLKDWALALDIDVDDDDMDGADVPKAWTVEALRPRVMEHCYRDVVRCQMIHERLREMGV